MNDMLSPANMEAAMTLFEQLHAGENVKIPSVLEPAVGVQMLKTMVREQGMMEVERFMLSLPQSECPCIHHFAPGLYLREVEFPAGILALGHRQRTEHLNIMLAGSATLVGEDGTAATFTAPMMGVGQPGRKAGVIHERVAWVNAYPNPDDEQDISTLEARWIEKTGDAVEAVDVARASPPGMLTPEYSRRDYQRVLEDYDLREDQAQAMTLADNLRRLPWGAYKIRVASSPIHGRGLFATAPIAEGEIIAPALIDGQRTIAGRWTNHGACPCAHYVRHDNGDLDLVALRPIGGCRGGFDGEEITIDYRQGIELALKGESA